MMNSGNFRGLLVGLAVVACSFGVGLDGAAEKDRVRELVESLPGFFGPQTMPTEPVAVSRCLAEWEPAEMLLLSIPLNDTLRDPRSFAFYYSVIEVASRYVDVGILHGLKGGPLTGRFLKRLGDEGLGADSLNRIRFIGTQSNQFWVRDFGPLFGLGIEGDLVVFDTIYRPLSDEQEAWAMAPTDIDSKFVENDDNGFRDYLALQRRSEVSPLYVAKFLRQHYQISCDVVRPPLHLQGGDYITDGSGRFFISEDTVLANGGRLKDVERILGIYFGAKELFVLNALPGMAAKHLDLLVCHAKPNTFIMTEAPSPREGENMSQRRMGEEVRSIQKANEEYLRRNLPDSEIYKVPMPPLVAEDSKRVMIKARAQIFAYVCEEIGIDYLKYFQLASGDPQRRLAQRRVLEHLNQVAGREIDLQVEADLDIVASRYLGADLDTLIETNVDFGTIYRSYVNSVQIVTGSGQKVWLLPRYRAREGESVSQFAEMEQEVERVYRSVDPDSILHWIDSDVMSEKLGAIHCVAMTLPRAATLSRSSRNLETLERLSQNANIRN